MSRFHVEYFGSILKPRGHSRAFDTHVVSYQNITTQRILLGEKTDWLKGHVTACS